MFYYEKNDKINALSRTEDALGRKYVSFFSADKEKFVKRYRMRFIAGLIIAIICFGTPFLFSGPVIVKIVGGLIIYAVLSFITALDGDGCSIISLFSKDSAMLKFNIDSGLYKADTDEYKYIAVYSQMFAEHGTPGFWNKFMSIRNEEIFQEATEIAVQESFLKDAISGMKKYIRETSESVIRDEVFQKLDEANDKHAALINRFNNFEDTVLRAGDVERDGKVLQYMEMVDQLDSEAA